MSTGKDDEIVVPPPQLTWPNIIGTLGVMLVLAGGAWALINQQFGSIKESFDERLKAFERAEEIRHRDLTRREDEFKQEFDKRTADRRLVDAEMARRIDLIERRMLDELVSRSEFRAMEKTSDERLKTQTDINRQAVDAYLSVKAWETWRGERDKLIAQMSSRMDRMNEFLIKTMKEGKAP